MQLKKMLVSLLAVAVSSVAFAFPTPQAMNQAADENLIPLLEQIRRVNEENEAVMESSVLPPLQGLVQIAKDMGNTDQEDLTPQQEQQVTTYTDQLTVALNRLAVSSLELVSSQLFAMEKIPEEAKQEVIDMLMGIHLQLALIHFEEKKLMAQEDIVIAREIFFPGQNDILEQFLFPEDMEDAAQ